MQGICRIGVFFGVLVAVATSASGQYLRLTGGFSTNADFFGNETPQGGWVGPYEDTEPLFPPNYATAQFEFYFDPNVSPITIDGGVSLHEVAAVSLLLTHAADNQLVRETYQLGDPGVTAVIEYSAGQGYAIASFRVNFGGGLFVLHLDGLSVIDEPQLGVLPFGNYEYIAQPRVQLATDEGEVIDGQFYTTNLGYRVDFASGLPKGDPGPGCALADVAAPFDVLDFSDVLAFLTSFGDGCP